MSARGTLCLIAAVALLLPGRAAAQAAAAEPAHDPGLERVGFYARMAKHAGSYMTPEQIADRHARRISDLLRAMRGVEIVTMPAGAGATAIMRSARTMSSQGTCYPTLVLDGQVVQQGGYGSATGSVDDLLSPDELSGLEVYASAQGIPQRYSGSTSPCGAILFWTAN